MSSTDRERRSENGRMIPHTRWNLWALLAVEPIGLALSPRSPPIHAQNSPPAALQSPPFWLFSVIIPWLWGNFDTYFFNVEKPPWRRTLVLPRKMPYRTTSETSSRSSTAKTRLWAGGTPP